MKRLTGALKSAALLLATWSMLPIVAVAAAASPSTTLRFEQFQLPAGRVLGFSQDSQGLLWLATSVGLKRFDGFELRTFRPPGAQPGTADVAVSEVLAASDGRLWFTGPGGLTAFDPHRDSFENVPLLTGDGRVPILDGLAQDAAGNLWIGSWGDGAFIVDPETLEVRHLSLADFDEEIPEGSRIIAFLPDPDGGVWLGAGSLGLFHLAGPDGPMRNYPLAYETELSAGVTVSSLARGAGGQLYAGIFPHGLFQLDASEQLVPLHIGASSRCPAIPHITGMAAVEDTLWIATDRQGLLRYQPSSGHCEVSRREPGSNSSLASDSIISLYASEERLWLGDLSGFTRLDFRSLDFSLYSHRPSDETSLWDNEVTAIYEDAQQQLWVGTSLGVSRYSPGSMGFARIRVGGHSVSAIVSWKGGQTLLGTNAGLYVLDDGALEAVPFEPVYSASATESSRYVMTMLVDQTGCLWVGTLEGLFRYDPDRNDISQFRHSANEASLPHDWVHALHEDDAGGLWIGTSGGGVARYVREGDQFARIPIGTDEPGVLPGGYVLAITEDSAGDLWISTAGDSESIHRLNPDTGAVDHWGTAEGLSNISYATLVERPGVIWSSSDRGLFRLDTRDASLQRYVAADGIQHRNFNPLAYFHGRDGRMYFGGQEGLTAFDPERLASRDSGPRAWITGIDVDGVALSPADARSRFGLRATPVFQPELTLQHNDRELRFSFSGDAPGGAEQLRFEHRLVGLNDTWTASGKERRTAGYSTLPAGAYRFEVRVSGVRGPWSSIQVIPITVKPAPWFTWWAISAYFAAIIIGSFTFAHWRSRSLRQRALFLEQAVAERTIEVEEQRKALAEQAGSLEEKSIALEALVNEKNRMFVDLSHELRTPLTLVTNPVRLIIERLSRDASARSDDVLERLRSVLRNADRLSELVEQLLKLSHLRHIDQRREVQNVSQMLRSLVERFRQRAEDKGLTLVWQSELLEDCWCNLIPDALEVLATNLLSNALKYTPGPGVVTVRLDSDPRNVILSVEDTGVGIPEDLREVIWERFSRADNTTGEAGSGLGLAIVRELAEKHGGSVELLSRVDHGSRFIVRLPRAQAGEATPSQNSSSVCDDHGHQNSATDGAKPVVLVVEDDAEMRSLIGEVLRDEFDCLFAGDGEEGLQKARTDMPDLIVSDVGMPKMDGFQLSRALKSQLETSHMPLVLLTARADAESRKQGYVEQADDYIAKPFDPDELRIRLRNLLARREQLKAYFKSQLEIADSTEDKSEHVTPQERRNQAFLEQLKSAIETDFADPNLNVNELATRFSLTPRQLHRKTVCMLGQTPLEVLRNYRLTSAKRKLRDGHPVKVVAFEVGFSSPASFSRAFKEHFGEAPAHWVAGLRAGNGSQSD